MNTSSLDDNIRSPLGKLKREHNTNKLCHLILCIFKILYLRNWFNFDYKQKHHLNFRIENSDKAAIKITGMKRNPEP